MTKILINSRGAVAEVTFFQKTDFPESIVMPSKIRSIVNFYAKALQRFPEKYLWEYCGFGFHWSNFILSNV